MKNKDVRIGIIGLGMVAEYHIAAYMDYAEYIGGSLAAFCDMDKSLLEKWSKATGVTKLYTDYQDMLKDDEVDAVIVLTPHHLHHRMAIDAANAGKHVGVEKCFALTMKDADEMIAAAKANDVRLMLLENCVFDPSVMKAKELIESGEIGNPVMIRVTLGQGTGPMYPGNPEKFSKAFHGYYSGANQLSDTGDWRFDPCKMGEGRFYDCGHHRFAVARYLGGEIDEISCMIEYASDGIMNREYASVTSFKYADAHTFGSFDEHFGAPESISTTGGSPFDDRVEIIGDKGVIWLNGIEGRIQMKAPLILYKDGKSISYENMDCGYWSGFRHESKEFVDAIVENREPSCNGEDGKKLLQIIKAAYKAAAEKRVVKVSEIHD